MDCSILGFRKTERTKENAEAAEVCLSSFEAAALDHMLDTAPMSAVFGGAPESEGLYALASQLSRFVHRIFI